MGMKRSWAWQGRHGLAVAFAFAVAMLLGAAPAGANVSSTAFGRAVPSAENPVVTGPVTGGNGQIVLQGTAFPLGSVGYAQSEYFLSGTAVSYTSAAPLGSSGQ